MVGFLLNIYGGCLPIISHRCSKSNTIMKDAHLSPERSGLMPWRREREKHEWAVCWIPSVTFTQQKVKLVGMKKLRVSEKETKSHLKVTHDVFTIQSSFNLCGFQPEANIRLDPTTKIKIWKGFSLISQLKWSVHVSYTLITKGNPNLLYQRLIIWLKFKL